MKYALAFLVTATLAGCQGPDDAAVTACRESLMKRLLSPASYVEIRHSDVSIEPLTFDWWLDANDLRASLSAGANDTPANQAARNTGASMANSGLHSVGTVTFEYDSQNSFGALLRGQSKCQVIMLNDEPIEVFYWAD